MSMPYLYLPRQSYSVAFDSSTVNLVVRQQPLQALVALDSKEKGRKPVDPPPIIEMTMLVDSQSTDNWLVSPYFFVIAVLLQGATGDTVVSGKELIGTSSSSLHKLKDIYNSDGGFFIFGDLSIKKVGVHRLRFNLFNTNKETGVANFVTSVDSQPFEVVSQKEFKGLAESTHLSRTFADQGVRLRLRKEAKPLSGQKRSMTYTPPPAPTSVLHNVHGSQGYTYNPHKRQRGESNATASHLAYRSTDDAISQYSQSTATPVRQPTQIQQQAPGQSHPYSLDFGSTVPGAQQASADQYYQFGSNTRAPPSSYFSGYDRTYGDGYGSRNYPQSLYHPIQPSAAASQQTSHSIPTTQHSAGYPSSDDYGSFHVAAVGGAGGPISAGGYPQQQQPTYPTDDLQVPALPPEYHRPPREEQQQQQQGYNTAPFNPSTATTYPSSAPSVGGRPPPPNMYSSSPLANTTLNSAWPLEPDPYQQQQPQQGQGD